MNGFPTALLLLFAAVGLVFVVVGIRQIVTSASLRRDGVVTDAVVTDLRYVRPSTTGEPASGLFFPVVRFTTATGEQVETPTLVGSSPAPARPGDRVQVRYDPADPRRVELTSLRGQTRTLGCLLVALGAVLMGFSGLLVAVVRLVGKSLS